MEAKINEVKRMLSSLTDEEIEKVSIFIAGMRASSRFGDDKPPEDDEPDKPP